MFKLAAHSKSGGRLLNSDKKEARGGVLSPLISRLWTPGGSVKLLDYWILLLGRKLPVGISPLPISPSKKELSGAVRGSDKLLV